MIIRKSATVKSIEGRKVLLELENNDFLKLDKDDMVGLSIGDELQVQIMTANEAGMEKDDLAKSLLNQLLQGVEDNEQKENNNISNS